ncbi:hypothetical protein EYF80_043670 [Liparis tanakae]|uniref:Uncharacterized protein n=1 Tax=Liparis tanakae TaxID=230148 RepID=A0A4Z2FZY4_9TELE|nr:hypothetical protein EYF80_043670 [Liparis tanakae]
MGGFTGHWRRWQCYYTLLTGTETASLSAHKQESDATGREAERQRGREAEKQRGREVERDEDDLEDESPGSQTASLLTSRRRLHIVLFSQLGSDFKSTLQIVFSISHRTLTILRRPRRGFL